MPDLCIGNTFIGYLSESQAALLIKLAQTSDELDITRVNTIAHSINEDDQYITDVDIHINFMKKAGT